MQTFTYGIIFQAMKGNNFYAFGDHGGLMVMVPQFQITNNLS